MLKSTLSYQNKK